MTENERMITEVQAMGDLVPPATKPKPPAGCFCGIIVSTKACMTCTCIDCMAIGRYGAVIVHKAGCGE